MERNIFISLFATGETKESRLCTLDAATQMMRGIMPLPDHILKERDSKRTVPATLQGYTTSYRAILDEAIQRAAGDISQAKQDKRLKWFKRQAPFISIAAIYNGTGKAAEDITGMTRLCLIDLDGLTDDELTRARQTAAQDPHTLLLTVSLSGRGLHIIAAYEADESHGTEGIKQSYKTVWTAINAHYEQILGLKGDKAVSDPTRGSFLAHDPQLYYNPTAQPFAQSELRELRGNRDLGGLRNLRDHRGDRKPHDLDSLYDQRIRPFLERAGDTFATGQRHHYTSRLAHQLNQYGITLDQATAWTVAHFAEADFDEREITRIVADIYKNNPEEFNTAQPPKSKKADKDDRKRTATVSDIKQWLDQHVSLRYNTLTARLEWSPSSRSWAPLTSRDLNTIWTQMAAETPVNIKHLEQVVNSDYAQPFNPLTAYLDSLEQMQDVKVEVFDESEFLKTSGSSENSEVSEKTESPSPIVLIDGRDPIAELAQTVRVQGDADTARFWLHCLRKWLVGMVAAWINEQVVNETILVLLGAQGTYKTTWFSLLMPPYLRPYFHTKIDAARLNKDDKLTLAENALICCEELDTLTSSEQNQLKAAVSMRYVNERAAYAHFKERRPHVASFCGTGNNTQLLTDRTGNRRWLPFLVDTIDTPQHIDYHHDLVFLQALTLYRHGYKYWLDADDMAYQTDHNRTFEAPRPEQEQVQLYFRVPTPDDAPEFITSTRAIQIIGAGGIAQKLNPVLVGRAFRDLGFKRVKAKGCYGYLVVQRTFDQMEQFNREQAKNAEVEP